MSALHNPVAARISVELETRRLAIPPSVRNLLEDAHEEILQLQCAAHLAISAHDNLKARQGAPTPPPPPTPPPEREFPPVDVAEEWKAVADFIFVVAAAVLVALTTPIGPQLLAVMERLP